MLFLPCAIVKLSSKAIIQNTRAHSGHVSNVPASINKETLKVEFHVCVGYVSRRLMTAPMPASWGGWWQPTVSVR